MIQFDPNLLAVTFALELAGLQEAAFVLRASFTAKIFRPICIILVLIHYIAAVLNFLQLTQKSLTRQESRNKSMSVQKQ